MKTIRGAIGVCGLCPNLSGLIVRSLMFGHFKTFENIANSTVLIYIGYSIDIQKVCKSYFLPYF